MEENNQQQNIPLLCRKKCGFYGSPNFDGLCSKCHRSAQAQLSVQQAECMAPAFEARLTMNDVRKSPDIPAESTGRRDTPSPNPGKKSPPATQSVDSALLDPVGDKLSQSVPGRSFLLHQHHEVELKSDAEATEATTAGLSQSFSELAKDNGDDDEEEEEARDSPAPVKSPRCHLCRKRVGPAGGYSCRCGGIFCSLHRYSDAHGCSFDYRKAGQDDIRRSNPQIVCSKLPKI